MQCSTKHLSPVGRKLISWGNDEYSFLLSMTVPQTGFSFSSPSSDRIGQRIANAARHCWRRSSYPSIPSSLLQIDWQKGKGRRLVDSKREKMIIDLWSRDRHCDGRGGVGLTDSGPLHLPHRKSRKTAARLSCIWPPPMLMTTHTQCGSHSRR